MVGERVVRCPGWGLRIRVCLSGLGIGQKFRKRVLPAPVLCKGNWARSWRLAPWLCWSSGSLGGESCLGLMALRAEDVLGGRGGKGACSDEEVCKSRTLMDISEFSCE